MEFKFNKGDHVSFVYGSVFSPSNTGMFEAVVNGGKIIARKGCGTSRGPEYRVDGFTGWWPEKCLVLVSRGPENLHCCEESSEVITYTQNETKCDTGDSGASEDRAKYRELYLKALKKTYGKVPFESETVEVGSLLEFTEAVIKATKEVQYDD